MSEATVQAAAPANEIYGVAGEFSDPHDLLRAIETLRGDGFTKLDALTPFPVHGLDEALGYSRSKLGFIVAGGGVCGLTLALLLQWWTGAVDYPLVIGGKPFFAFEFSIPITFELTVLLAAFAAVFGMLVMNGLPRFYHPVFNYSRFRRISDDHYLLVVEKNGEAFHAGALKDRLTQLGAVNTEVLEA